MPTASTDKVFAGSIPKLYDEYLVPMIFEPYADDLVRRVTARMPKRILEIAAGTGVVTRRLATAFPADVAIVATDLNQPMLDRAAAVGTARAIEWHQADAMQLPFADSTFDAVICQFGVMFFPDKPKAFAEARRVLAPGGFLLFNAWDRLEENEFPDVVMAALELLFPADPPRFMSRTPHGYFDKAAIACDLQAGGFTAVPQIETVAARSQSPSPRHVAIAFCQGTPMRNEIESRGKMLAEATDAAAAAVEKRFGAGAIEGKIQAHVVMVER